jgi:protein-arginine kinase activator protein McsA
MRNLDRCEKCQRGRMRIYHTRTVGSSRIRFMKCDGCHTPGKESLQVDHLGRIVYSHDTSGGTRLHQPAAATE